MPVETPPSRVPSSGSAGPALTAPDMGYSERSRYEILADRAPGRMLSRLKEA